MEDITIIINSYKPKKKELFRSIKSCLDQIMVNVTIIVSTIENDPTISFLEELNNPKINLVISLKTEHPGIGSKGIYYQLNKALKIVKTDYVSYLSSNDRMLKTKSINEINKIKKENTICCFSLYNIFYTKKNYILKKTKFNIEKKDITFEYLLKRNYINDCATINLKRLKIPLPLQFNYKKYENFCYWNLWLTIAHKYGIGCISFNDRVEWEYIRDIDNSQSLNKSKDKIKYENNLKKMITNEYSI